MNKFALKLSWDEQDFGSETIDFECMKGIINLALSHAAPEIDYKVEEEVV